VADSKEQQNGQKKVLNEKNVFSACNNFILLHQIRGNSINNCDF
jgi:hypothetical protein